MRILQVGLGNNPGGVEAFVMNYYGQLAARGVSFDFICMYGKIAYEEQFQALGSRIFYVPNVKKNYFGYVREFRRVLRENDYDAVHIHMLSVANLVPLRLVHEAGIKNVIVHSHSTKAPGFLRGLLDTVNRPRMQKMAAKYLACGEQAGRWLYGDAAYDDGKVTLISNAIATEKYRFSREVRERKRAELGFAEKHVIGHVGRFDLPKNHERILKIFVQIRKEDPDAVLWLIGDGMLKEQIQKQAEQAGLKDYVVFAGVRSDVSLCLSAMDVFLFPSLFEALPFTLLEVQANGLSCVMSEAVSEEAVLNAESMHRLSLDASDQEWASAVLACMGQRQTDDETIRKRFLQAHYEIKEAADQLYDLYAGGENNGEEN